MSTSANRFVWFELMTSDVKAAQAFYGHVVGWRMQDAGMPFPYVLASPPGSPEGGGAVAGLMELTPEMTGSGMPPCWGASPWPRTWPAWHWCWRRRWRRMSAARR